MIDLFPVAGVAAWVDPDTARLELGAALAAEEAAVRDLDAARDVYRFAPEEAPPLYHMLNGITARGCLEPTSSLRYELTALRAGEVGPEWVKTIGHVHDAAPDGLGYPEAYEVVEGSAVFVLFRALDHLQPLSVADPGPVVCVLIDGVAGDRFVIPPGWHHLAVNGGSRAMVFADVVGRAVVPNYSLLRTLHGAPVFLGPGGVVRNPRYGGGILVRLSCSQLPAPGSRGRFADVFFSDEREAFDYLLAPARYGEVWRAFDELVAASSTEPLGELPVA